MATYLGRIIHSGTKIYSHLTADNLTELWNMARRLNVQVKAEAGSNGPHLDLSGHQRILARRYGAKEGR